MGRFASLISICSVFLVSAIFADEISKQPTYINTFQDERNVNVINDNFKRMADFGVVESSSGFVVGSLFTITTVTFVTNRADTSYIPVVTASWDAAARVLQKTTTGFVIVHNAPGASQTLDWAILR